jgi:hypothetical protein
MSKKYVDRKITVWERFHFDDETSLGVVIQTIEGKFEEIVELNGFITSETLYETGEEMSVSENGECHTIEVYDGDQCIWDNKDKFNTIVG